MTDEVKAKHAESTRLMREGQTLALAERLEDIALRARKGEVDGMAYVVTFTDSAAPISTMMHICPQDDGPLASLSIATTLMGWLTALGYDCGYRMMAASRASGSQKSAEEAGKHG